MHLHDITMHSHLLLPQQLLLDFLRLSYDDRFQKLPLTNVSTVDGSDSPALTGLPVLINRKCFLKTAASQLLILPRKVRQLHRIRIPTLMHANYYPLKEVKDA